MSEPQTVSLPGERAEDGAQYVAHYLEQHPDFFEQHPELLMNATLPHPHNGQAISLVERQSLLLRSRIKHLEERLTDLLRNGEENDVIGTRVTQWTRALLQQEDPALLPDTAIDQLKQIFNVPLGALRIWGVRPEYQQLVCAQPVSDDLLRLADSMAAPFCGVNVDFEAATWMAEDGNSVQSLAMLPLRVGASPKAFGLLVLGSPDRERFHITKGTAFLTRIAELASAALARLRATQA